MSIVNAIVVCVSCVLAACGGSKGENTKNVGGLEVSGDIYQIGSVWIDTETGSRGYRQSNTVATHVTAQFIESADVFDERIFTLTNSISSPPQTHHCSAVLSEKDPFSFADDFDAYIELSEIYPDRTQLTTLDVGNSIEISTPAGPWHSLLQGSDGIYSSYRAEVGQYQEGYIAAGSTLSFQGGDYPGMANVSLPTVEPVLQMASSSMPIHTVASGATLSWLANSSTNQDVITVSIEVGHLQLYGGGASYFETYSTLKCTAPDTGLFQIPAELDDLLSAGDFAVGAIILHREAFDAIQQEDAVLVMTARSEAILELDD